MLPILLLFLLGLHSASPSSKELKAELRRFKSDWDEIWQEFSPSKYTSIEEIGFLTLSR